jgi:hypothetical protein
MTIAVVLAIAEIAKGCPSMIVSIAAGNRTAADRTHRLANARAARRRRLDGEESPRPELGCARERPKLWRNGAFTL